MSGHCTCGYRKIKDETKEYLNQTKELENGEAPKTNEHLREGFSTRGTKTERTPSSGSE
jgi:hypothetical protein